jgi:histidine kinase
MDWSRRAAGRRPGRPSPPGEYDGLNIAQRSSARSGSGSAAGVLEGTLAYMSPEQTGRMNRSVDPRSDLYSLGATLYELLTGRPPFVSDKPLELVHAHIARLPRPPHHVDDSIPVVVSDILLRLLAKRAEDRYQSARGLEADLDRCLDQLEQTGALARFDLGVADGSGRFGLSQELYGRTTELAALGAAFEQVCTSPTVGVVLVQGEPGVGKSTLVRELYRQVVDAGGWFVSGHAGEGDSGVPYAALASALHELTHQLLASSDAVLEAWRSRILPALGPNAGIVTRLVPDLALVLGEQPAPPELSAAADQARFRITLGRFVRTLGTAEAPLVVFLDDLQWADQGTLDLLELFITDPRVGHLLIVGAFRPPPEEGTHPLVELPARLRRAGHPPRELRLRTLDVDQVGKLLADSLHLDVGRTRELADVCLLKTDGNPFFLSQFLCSLHEDGALRFESSSGWTWDLARIGGLDITDNVVELVSGRMGRMSRGAQDALRVAACSGQTFDAEVVSLLSGVEPLPCLAALQEAAAEGLVTPAGGAFQFARRTAGESSGHLPRRYRFVHDRIRQAAWSLSSEEQRQVLHLSLARTLLQALPEEPAGEELFAVVGHFAQTGPLLVEPDERLAVAALCLDAGRRARRALAVSAALEHLARGVDLLPDAAWAEHYAVSYGLHIEATLCAQMNQDDAGMERWGQAVLDHSQSPLDSVPVYAARVSFFQIRRQPGEALEWFIRGARLLKLRLPLRPGLPDILASFVRLQFTLATAKPLDREDVEPMTDPRSLALLSLMQAAGPAAYFASPNLIPLFAFAITSHTARKGVCSVSGWGIGG